MTAIVTGDFWNVSNEAKPWGLFDPNSQLDIPFDWNLWLIDFNGIYSGHLLIPDPMLEVVSGMHSAGVITALMKVATGMVPTVGAKYPVTCRITAVAGALTLIDDRTVWLKIKDR